MRTATIQRRRRRARTPRCATTPRPRRRARRSGSSPVMLAQDLGVGARGGLVGRDHEAAGIRNLLAHLGEPAVGRPQHRRDPLPLGVERRAPGLRGDVLRVVLPELGLHLVAGLGAPAHLPGVDEEDHGAHDAVLERAAVAVGVVGAREADAVLVGVVLDERDRRGVAAERRARQQQPARRARRTPRAARRPS